MEPKYIQIKNFILGRINSGVWVPADKVYSENVLAENFSVSRMTARKAIDALCSEGVLVRSQGLGTFVSDTRPMSALLEIQNIADEVRGRGHSYACRILTLDRIKNSSYTAMMLAMQEGQAAFHSTIVHLEDDRAVQYEDRYVNPGFAPEYIIQDFTSITPNAYLSEVAPLTEADHVVEAQLPNGPISKALQMSRKDPCLKITRRTWSIKGVVSIAYLYHPGDRYRIGGHLNFQNTRSMSE